MKHLKTALLILPCIALTSCVTQCGANASNNGWGVNVGTILNADTLNTILGGQTSLATLSNTDIIQGLKEALNIGSTHVVSQLGTFNGFNADPNIKIPLPDTLAKVDSALSTIGMNSLTSDLETRLNRAAEAATPKAKALFLSAIQNMTINDAREILNGPQDAATQYLRKAMGPQLAQDMQPLIQSALSEAGAIRAYDNVISRYEQIPFVSTLAGNTKTQLNDYVTTKAMDGIFYYVAREEAAIRTNPAKRTTEILQKVFGARR
ncbi:MAG: DUF4197 domain-containing protein [Alphaproteobacteria bacterium]|nr:DUF4197 domain-containing protein [Alphaproteobacteria bacterium]